MVPPRVSQFNWVDLGLPSGTLWLDRMVGAPSPTETGLFYQWGDTVGHSLAEGYVFSLDHYTEKGLDLISSDLDDAHDAARAFYGPEAKMPSASQFEELISNCVFSSLGNDVHLITSNINGHSIRVRGGGYFKNLEHNSRGTGYAWSNGHASHILAYSIHISAASAINYSDYRYYGLNVMAVHS